MAADRSSIDVYGAAQDRAFRNYLLSHSLSLSLFLFHWGTPLRSRHAGVTGRVGTRPKKEPESSKQTVKLGRPL